VINIYLTDTVTHISTTAIDQWGEPTESESNISCKIEWETRYIKDEMGTDILSTAHLWLAVQDIDQEDLLKIDGRRYRILKISKPVDWTVNKHMEIWV
jgi:hypothetical protein